jgi:putative redox protein
MADQLTCEARWTGKYHFEGTAEFDHPVPIDYLPPLGDGLGHKPMELLLMSLASCSGQTTVSLMQKMRQDVRGFEVRAVGRKRENEEHPKVFTAIHLEFRVSGPGLDPAVVEKAIKMSEDKYCPVWAMLKGSVAVSSSFVIE